MTQGHPDNEFMAYMKRMVEAYEGMPEEEKEDLHRWEKEHLDGHSVATSDWPGWEKYVGKAPWKAESKIAASAHGTVVEFDASRAKEVRIPCASCRIPTRHEVLFSADVTQDLYQGGITGWTSHQVVRCLGCESFSFRRSHRNTEDFYVTDEGEAVLFDKVEVYPPRAAGMQKLSDIKILPYEVEAIYEETYKAVVSGLPILAAVGMRPLIEAVCKEEDAQGHNLEKKIDDLMEKRVLTPSGAEILHKLGFMGNEAAHEVKRHNAKALGTAFDVVEHVLQSVYLIPGKASRLRKSKGNVVENVLEDHKEGPRRKKPGALLFSLLAPRTRAAA